MASSIGEYEAELRNRFQRVLETLRSAHMLVDATHLSAQRLSAEIVEQGTRLPLLRAAQVTSQALLGVISRQAGRCDVRIAIGLGTIEERVRNASALQPGSTFGAGPIQLIVTQSPESVSEGDARRTVDDVFGPGQIGVRVRCELHVLGRTVPTTVYFAVGFTCASGRLQTYLGCRPRLRPSAPISFGLLRSFRSLLDKHITAWLNDPNLLGNILATGGATLLPLAFDIGFEHPPNINRRALVFGRLRSLGVTEMISFESERAPDDFYEQSLVPTASPQLEWRANLVSPADQLDWWEVREISLTFEMRAVLALLVPMLRTAIQPQFDKAAKKYCDGKVKYKRLDPNPLTILGTGTASSDGKEGMLLLFSVDVRCKSGGSVKGSIFNFELNVWPTTHNGIKGAELRLSYINAFVKPAKFSRIQGFALPLGNNVQQVQKSVSAHSIQVTGEQE